MALFDAVIFDMDGLMFDTETLAYNAWKLTAKRLGFHMTDDVFNLLKGRTEAGIMAEMEQAYPGKPVYEWRKDMTEEKHRLMHALEEAPAKEGLYSLVRFLRENGFAVAVASSSPPENIHHYLRLANLTDSFPVVVSGEEVAHGKPEPDIFLKACEKLGVLPSRSLVLEDSLAGILAAKAAGCTGYVVPDHGYLTEEMTQSADRVFKTLEEVRQFLEENIGTEKGVV